MATVDLFDVLAALRGRLATLSGYAVGDVAFINKDFDPSSKSLYLAEALLPGEERQITNDQTELRGIYQLTVMVPSGTSISTALDRATTIKNHFPPKLQLGLVNIDRATAANPVQYGDWYGVPVSLYFRTYATTSI